MTTIRPPHSSRGQRHRAVGQRTEAADGDRHPPERVGGRRVLAGADDQQVGPERAQHRRDDRVDRVQVAVVARAGGQRDVDVRALAGARPAHLELAAVGGVEPVLVQRDGQHGRVVEEDRLRPVAVVHVPVEDRDALHAALALRPARRHAVLLKRQKPIGGLALGVVAGRPQQRERVVELALQHRLGGRRAGRPRRAASPRASPGPVQASTPSSTGLGQRGRGAARARRAPRSARAPARLGVAKRGRRAR